MDNKIILKRRRIASSIDANSGSLQNPHALMAEEEVGKFYEPPLHFFRWTAVHTAAVLGRWEVSEIASPIAALRPVSVAGSEPATASLAFAAVAVLVASMLATAGWALRSQQQSTLLDRQQRVEVIGNLLAAQAEEALASGELSRVRRQVMETARSSDLVGCRIVVGANGVIADADPSKINTIALPANWGNAIVENGIGSSVRSFPIAVAGKGMARLEITPAGANRDYWQTSAGVGIVGALTLGSLLILYRMAQAKLRPLAVVRDRSDPSVGEKNCV